MIKTKARLNKKIDDDDDGLSRKNSEQQQKIRTINEIEWRVYVIHK